MPLGLIELYSKNLGYKDCGPHARLYEPLGWHQSPATKTYPLQLASIQAPALAAFQCTVSSQAIHGLGSRAGLNPSEGRSRPRHRERQRRARVQRARPDTGRCGRHRRHHRGRGARLRSAWYDPLEPGVASSLCKNGCVNVLTRDIPTSNLAMGNCG